MQKTFLLLCLVLLITGHSFAQETQSPYEIALERIERAEHNDTEILYLSGLGLSEVPPEIGKLSNLRQLVLSNNKLSGLAPEIFQLSNLQALILTNNNLTHLAPEIGNLTQLTVLALPHNQLSSLPAEIGKLSNLQRLYLYHNQFTSLPPEMGNLGNLQILNLSYNQLTELPSTFANLDSVCSLILWGNAFESVPMELATLEGFDSPDTCPASYGLWLDNSLLDTFPDEVFEAGTPAMLDYIQNMVWWHLQKLILGGVSALGLVTLSVLGFRWKNRSGKQKRKNEEIK
jgi:Leucine-rich repeat (LRR) protein